VALSVMEVPDSHVPMQSSLMHNGLAASSQAQLAASQMHLGQDTWSGQMSQMQPWQAASYMQPHQSAWSARMPSADGVLQSQGAWSRGHSDGQGGQHQKSSYQSWAGPRGNQRRTIANGVASMERTHPGRANGNAGREANPGGQRSLPCSKGAATAAKARSSTSAEAEDEEAKRWFSRGCESLPFLIDAVTAGGSQQEQALRKVRNDSFRSKYCSRMSQGALHAATDQQVPDLAVAFKGCVVPASKNIHANYPLQEIVMKVTVLDQIAFIVEELTVELSQPAAAVGLLTNAVGTRIFQRLIEKWGTDDRMTAFVDLILNHAPVLISDWFGHYILDKVLEHGRSCHKKLIADALLKDVRSYVLSRSGAYVAALVLKHCALPEQKSLVQELLRLSPMELAMLVRNQKKNMLTKHLREHAALRELLDSDAVREYLSKTRCGKRMLGKLQLG